MSDVLEGYRMSEVGFIPDEWDVKRIGAVATIFGGGTPSTTVSEYWGGQIPWVSAGDVSRSNGRYIRNTADSISKIGLASCSARIMPTGTNVIIARGATVGRMAQLGSAMAFNQTCYGLLPVGGTDQNYLYYAMLFSVNSMRALTYGTIFGTITTNSFEQWQIPFPPLPEQQAIASALSDVDALIAALEQLITKKRNIKQGAMQQLLTGEKRLPGFGGGWEVEKIKNISSITTGARNTQDKIDDAEYPFFVRSSIVERINSYSFDGEAVLTAGDGVGTGKVVHYINGKFDFHQRVYKISDFNEKIDGYFFYLFFSNYFLKRIMAMTAKSSVDSVRMEMIAEMPIPLPPRPEQQAIVQILSDMDTEIEALNQKRDKYKTIKQGMMQELLTGKTRLV